MKNSSYKLTNTHLAITINTLGAELSSIQKNNLEYIWQAAPKFWGRHSPILFPIVGRLIDDEYIYKGERYPMGQHGFARDQEFTVFAQAKDSITFELVTNDDLRKVYPFDFVLQIKYSLVESIVRVEYLVKNPSEQDDLLFSIGAHPAFNCPMESGQRRDEYELEFDVERAPVGYLAENNYYNGDSVAVLDDKGILKLPDSIFDRDSFTFRPNPFAQATLRHRPSGKKYLTMHFENYPYLTIWSKNNLSPFICIEPWHGGADNVGHNKLLAQKEGIIRLSPETDFGCFYDLEIF